MSLIDDALKRAQAAGEVDRGKPGDRPWIPAPMPDPGLARRHALVRWMGVAATLALLAAAGVWLYRREAAGPPPVPAGEGRGEGRPAAMPPPATPTPDVVALATPVAVAPPAGSRPTSPSRPPEEGAAVEKPAAPPPTLTASRPAQGIVNGRTYTGAVTLPGGARIELGGIVWSETEPRALLNDRIVATGGYVEGFSVVRIEEDRVVLEKDGATISLSVR